MTEVRSVTGPVDAGALGRVLSHEHVILATNGFRDAYPGVLPERDEVIDFCVAEIAAVKAAGWDTLIDHTTFDLGRDIGLLRTVAERTGMRIVAATGLLDIPRWFLKRPAHEIAPLFVRDLTEGIAGTTIRAGIIKCALDRAGLTPAAEEVLRACAIAHRETGVPISTHTWAEGRLGAIQQRVFEREGVNLEKVVIGHSGDSEDLDYLRGLMRRGSIIGMDRFGLESILPDKRRAEVVAILAAEGFADRMTLSQDANAWSDRNVGLPPESGRTHWNFHNLEQRTLPNLRALGVTEDQLALMTGGNIARLYGAVS
jgi:phosphotriesterase-related protein